MEMTRARENISLAEWTHTYVPFGFHAGPYGRRNGSGSSPSAYGLLYLGRTFVFDSASKLFVSIYFREFRAKKSTWLLFWTFSFASTSPISRTLCLSSTDRIGAVYRPVLLETFDRDPAAIHRSLCYKAGLFDPRTGQTQGQLGKTGSVTTRHDLPTI